MSKVFDDIKSFLNDWWTQNGPKMGDMVKTTAEKAENLTQKARLKYDLYQAGRDLEKAYEELGEKVYHDISEDKKFDFSGDDNIQVLMDQIVVAEKKVQEVRNELAQVGMTPEDDPFEEETPEDINAADVPDTDETKGEA